MQTANRIDWVNIFLMLLSCSLAFLLPFEVFLFAYAFLGPLHYLTEISWLHDRNYFTKRNNDYRYLLLFCVLLTANYFAYRYGLWPYGKSIQHTQAIMVRWNLYEKMLAMALLIAAVVAFVKNNTIRWIAIAVGFLMIVLFLNKNAASTGRSLQYLLLAFIPTLIHVYVFTGFFILYGALKSKSKTGLLSFLVFLACPLLLIVIPVQVPAAWNEKVVRWYGNAFSRDGFFSLSKNFLEKIIGYRVEMHPSSGKTTAITHQAQQWEKIVYYSKAGVLFVRFIAFAYLYHYLNWFSKTAVIQWHKIPKSRLYWIIGIWLGSIAIYIFDYSWGFQWLFFLSFTHVLLEFPLNFVSIAGIFQMFKLAVFGRRFGNSS